MTANANARSELIVSDTARAPVPAVADDASALMRIIDRASRDPSFDVTKLKELIDVRDRWEANEARKAFNVAFADFKKDGVKITRRTEITDGPLKGKFYAQLSDVVSDITGALAKHGLSHSWRITKDEPQWIEVTCFLKHERGHVEAVSMGGEPDTGGAKSKIQARASTVSYLERYTLKAGTGTAEEGDDGDGAGDLMPEAEYRGWVTAIEATTTKEAARAKWREGIAACEEIGDRETAAALKDVMLKHVAFIEKAGK